MRLTTFIDCEYMNSISIINNKNKLLVTDNPWFILVYQTTGAGGGNKRERLEKKYYQSTNYKYGRICMYG